MTLVLKFLLGCALVQPVSGIATSQLGAVSRSYGRAVANLNQASHFIRCPTSPSRSKSSHPTKTVKPKKDATEDQTDRAGASDNGEEEGKKTKELNNDAQADDESKKFKEAAEKLDKAAKKLEEATKYFPAVHSGGEGGGFSAILSLLLYTVIGSVILALGILIEWRHREIMKVADETRRHILELRNRLAFSFDKLDKRIDAISFTAPPNDTESVDDEPPSNMAGPFSSSRSTPQRDWLEPAQEERSSVPQSRQSVPTTIGWGGFGNQNQAPPRQAPASETAEALGQQFIEALKKTNWQYNAAWDYFVEDLRTRYEEYDLWYDLKAPALELLDRKKETGWWAPTLCRVLVLRGPQSYQGWVFHSHVCERSPALEDFRILQVDHPSQMPLNRDNLVVYQPAVVSRNSHGWTLVQLGRVVYK